MILLFPRWDMWIPWRVGFLFWGFGYLKVAISSCFPRFESLSWGSWPTVWRWWEVWMIYQEPKRIHFVGWTYTQKTCGFFLCVSSFNPDWEEYPLTKSITPLGNDQISNGTWRLMIWLDTKLQAKSPTNTGIRFFGVIFWFHIYIYIYIYFFDPNAPKTGNVYIQTSS